MTDSASWTIELIRNPDERLRNEIIAIEQEEFGEGGMNQWFLPPFARYGRVYCLWVDERLAGVAELLRDWSDYCCAYLFGIVMRPGYRNQGFGSILLGHIIDDLRRAGVRKLQLTVDPNNERGLALYTEKFGFIIDSFYPNKYGPGQDRYLLQLDITEDVTEVK